VQNTSTFLKDIVSMGYKDTYRALFGVASEQGGYFTAHQALGAGYGYPEQHYHVTHGNWLKVQRGIYRLRDYPPPDRDDLIILTLMSNDRSGEPQAVVSYETALAVHELGDVNPERVHLTVPRNFRKQMPSRIVLHRADLNASDCEQRDGYHVTTPIRTLLDVGTSAESWPYLGAAIRDALRRGLIPAQKLRMLRTGGEASPRLQTAIDAAEQSSEAR
jgi:predicted transcriptional regulator of viral defense system